MRCTLITGIILLVIFNFAPAADYELVDLGINSNYGSYAWGINDSGQVIGSIVQEVDRRAFLWEGSVLTELGTLGGDSSNAYGINEQGQIVGGAETSPGSLFRAFLYENGTMTNLGGPSGRHCIARKINDVGQVVGFTDAFPGGTRGFLWEDGVRYDLYEMDNLIDAMDINVSGQIVGAASSSFGPRAVLWENGNKTDLGTLGGSMSWANGINEMDQIVGWAKLSNEQNHAFLYEDGTMIDLGTLGYTESWANAINDNSQIVGSLDPGGGQNKQAFLYYDGEMINLNDLIDPSTGWILTNANDINNHGWIVGYGLDPDGIERGFLLIPEPCTLSLLLVGGLALARRRRR